MYSEGKKRVGSGDASPPYLSGVLSRGLERLPRQRGGAELREAPPPTRRGHSVSYKSWALGAATAQLFRPYLVHRYGVVHGEGLSSGQGGGDPRDPPLQLLLQPGARGGSRGRPGALREAAEPSGCAVPHAAAWRLPGALPR